MSQLLPEYDSTALHVLKRCMCITYYTTWQ